jgi:urease accessory protein
MPAGVLSAGEKPMKRLFAAVLAIILGGVAASACAHGVHGAAASFSGGFAHPFLGLDHAFAMIAIGLYAAERCFPSRWQVGAAACGSLVLGAMFAGALPAEPFLEALVAVSVCALGLLLLGRRFIAPHWALSCIVLFAFAHGAIHAIEQPVEFASAEYVGGVVAGSIVLQAIGAAVARLLDRRAHLAGVPLAAAGAWILISSMA